MQSLKFLRIAVVAAIAVLGASASGIAQSAPSLAPASVTQKDDGKTVHVKLGQAVEIMLPGNISTGYSWTVSSIGGTAVNQVGDVAYQSSVPQKPGSGGVYSAHFNAGAAGVSTVTLIYAQPWIKPPQPTEAFTVTIEVTP